MFTNTKCNSVRMEKLESRHARSENVGMKKKNAGKWRTKCWNGGKRGREKKQQESIESENVE